MKKSLILYIVWLFTALCARAQVENYALSFAGNGSVHCGELVQMEQQTSYTIQFWICPDEWNEGAVIFKSGDKFSACLDTEGSIVFTVGETSLRATATSIGLSKNLITSPILIAILSSLLVI